MAKPNKVVQTQPKVRKAEESKELRGAKVKEHSAYWQQIEAEKKAAGNDWSDYNDSFFSQFRKQD